MSIVCGVCEQQLFDCLAVPKSIVLSASLSIMVSAAESDSGLESLLLALSVV